MATHKAYQQLLRKGLPHWQAAVRDGLFQTRAGLQQEFVWGEPSAPFNFPHEADLQHRGPFYGSSDSTGYYWSPLHSQLFTGMGPLALSAQVLPALNHKHQQHRQHLLPNTPAPPPPPPPFQRALPLPVVPTPSTYPAYHGTLATPALVNTGMPAMARMGSSEVAAGVDKVPRVDCRSEQQGVEGAGEAANKAGVSLASAEPLKVPAEAHSASQQQAQSLATIAPSHSEAAQAKAACSISNSSASLHGACHRPTHQGAGGARCSMQQQPTNGPQRKRARGSGVSVALNKSIMNASCVAELLALVRVQGHSFDFFNISSAVSRAPKLVEAEHVRALASAHPGSPTLPTKAPGAVEPLGFDGAMAIQPGIATNGSSPPQLAAGTPVSASAGSAAKDTSSTKETPAIAALGGEHSATSAGLSDRAKALADHLYALSLQHLHTFDARGIANTAWAFAKMRYVPDGVLPAALASEASVRIDEFAAQNLSNLAWAMVYMHHRDPHLLALMANRVMWLLDQFKPQELANIMWAFASLEHHDPGILSALCRRASQLGPYAFKEQELSNIIWALGRAHHHEGPLLDMLLQETRTKLGSFQPQGVSNIVWALGQLNHASPSLLAAISQRYSQPGALRAFDGQGLCNLAWGTAVLGFHHPPLMAALADEAVQRAATSGLAGQHQHVQAGAESQMCSKGEANAMGCRREIGHSPLCLTTVLWAAVTLGNQAAAAKLLQTVACEVKSPAITSTWEPTSLAQAAWASAHMQQMGGSVGVDKQQQTELLAQLAEAVASHVDRFNGQPLALAVSAFCAADASTGGHSKLVEQLARRVERAAPSFSEQQCKVCTEALQQHQALCPGAPSAPAAFDALLKRTTSATAHLPLHQDAVCAKRPAAAGLDGLRGGTFGAPQHAAWHSMAGPQRWKGSGRAGGAGPGMGPSWCESRGSGSVAGGARGHALGGARGAQIVSSELEWKRGLGQGRQASVSVGEAAEAAFSFVHQHNEDMKETDPAGDSGWLTSKKKVQEGAQEEPWASAWPEGLFKDELKEAGSSSALGLGHKDPHTVVPAAAATSGRNATSKQGGMWGTAGGLGNGSMTTFSSGAAPAFASMQAMADDCATNSSGSGWQVSVMCGSKSLRDCGVDKPAVNSTDGLRGAGWESSGLESAGSVLKNSGKGCVHDPFDGSSGFSGLLSKGTWHAFGLGEGLKADPVNELEWGMHGSVSSNIEEASSAYRHPKDTCSVRWPHWFHGGMGGALRGASLNNSSIADGAVSLRDGAKNAGVDVINALGCSAVVGGSSKPEHECGRGHVRSGLANQPDEEVSSCWLPNLGEGWALAAPI